MIKNYQGGRDIKCKHSISMRKNIVYYTIHIDGQEIPVMSLLLMIVLKS